MRTILNWKTDFKNRNQTWPSTKGRTQQFKVKKSNDRTQKRVEASAVSSICWDSSKFYSGVCWDLLLEYLHV